MKNAWWLCLCIGFALITLWVGGLMLKPVPMAWAQLILIVAHLAATVIGVVKARGRPIWNTLLLIAVFLFGQWHTLEMGLIQIIWRLGRGFAP